MTVVKGVAALYNSSCCSSRLPAATVKHRLLRPSHPSTHTACHHDCRWSFVRGCRFNVIKLADFGSAFREDDADNEPTPYLVSRFYRCVFMWLWLCCCRGNFNACSGQHWLPGYHQPLMSPEKHPDCYHLRCSNSHNAVSTTAFR